MLSERLFLIAQLYILRLRFTMDLLVVLTYISIMKMEDKNKFYLTYIPLDEPELETAYS